MLPRPALVAGCFAVFATGTLFLAAPAADPKEPKDAKAASSPLEKIKAGKTTKKGSEPKKPEVLALLGERDSRVDCGAFGLNGKYLAMGGPGDSIVVWDFPEIRKIATLRNPETVCLAFSPSGKLLAAGDSQGTVKLWRVSPGSFTLAATVPNASKEGPIWSLAFFPDGKSLATGGSDGLIKIWDVTKSRPTTKATLTGHKSQVRSLAISADGALLASGGWKDESVKLWDVSAAKPPLTHSESYKSLVTAVSFAGEGNKLAVGAADGKVRLYDVEAGKLKNEKVIAAKKDKVAGLVLDPKGETVMVLVYWDASEDRLYQYNLAGELLYEGGYGQRIQGLAAAPDGRHFAAVHERNASLVRLPEAKPKK